jgi:hypothetical protein
MSTTVLFLSKDVFFWPVVREAVERLSYQLIIVSKADDPKLIGLKPSEVSCCLIDLSSVPAAEIHATLGRLKEQFGEEPRFVAFGPHVQEARLQAAVEAGCNPVLSRGQLTARLNEYLADWLAADRP